MYTAKARSKEVFPGSSFLYYDSEISSAQHWTVAAVCNFIGAQQHDQEPDSGTARHSSLGDRY